VRNLKGAGCDQTHLLDAARELDGVPGPAVGSVSEEIHATNETRICPVARKKIGSRQADVAHQLPGRTSDQEAILNRRRANCNDLAPFLIFAAILRRHLGYRRAKQTQFGETGSVLGFL
jgi:hypothetical protein